MRAMAWLQAVGGALTTRAGARTHPRTPAASADENLWRALLQPRRRPAKGPQGLRMAGGREIEQLPVLGRLRALGEQGPVDRRLRRRKVEPAQVAQQQQAGLGSPTHELGGLLAHGAQRSAGAVGSRPAGV